MGLPKRDLIATALVGVAGVVYGFWVVGLWSSVRVTGIVVLALGFIASAAAVVPGFEQLIRGNQAYLATTTLVGLTAFIAGILMLITASGIGLTVMTVAMGVLWLVATTHHSLLATRAPVADTTVLRVNEKMRRAA
ncbi:MAG TPA: hypothetical protein VFR41_04990 [Acidimicrobiia bacterium]|nr:hypothetical protein [Acidimicrobiia bacterium]